MKPTPERATLPVDPDAALNLHAAHELVLRAWPGPSPPAAVAAAYFEHAATLYDQVARTDPSHHHEALFWANDQRQEAEHLRQQAATTSISRQPIPESAANAYQEKKEQS
jgi:hypothetical protein